MKAACSLLLVLLTLAVARPSRADGFFDSVMDGIGGAFKGAFSPQAPASEDQYAHPANAGDQYPVEIEVYLSAAYMTINYPFTADGTAEDINGVQIPIRGGGPGFPTPTGCFSPDYLDPHHTSHEFKLPNGQFAPMPWSIFFKGGKALHQGNPNAYSHGCVHVGVQFAKTIFNIVKNNGRGSTRICIYE